MVELMPSKEGLIGVGLVECEILIDFSKLEFFSESFDFREISSNFRFLLHLL